MKTNLKKYFHPSSLNHLIYTYAHVQGQEPKKGQQKVQTLKKTTGIWPSGSYYSLMKATQYCPNFLLQRLLGHSFGCCLNYLPTIEC